MSCRSIRRRRSRRRRRPRWQQADDGAADARRLGRDGDDDGPRRRRRTPTWSAAMFGVSSLAMLATSWGSASGSPKKAEMMAARREYLRHLAGAAPPGPGDRRQAAGRAVLPPSRPGPALVHRRAATGSGSGGPNDPDFGVVRVAVGPQTLATPLVPPVTRPLEDLEPMTAGALRRFLDAYAVVPDLPVALSLRGFARVFVPRRRRRTAPRAGPGDAHPARRLPRPGRPADRGLRRPGAAAAVGVGQVAAARPAPDPDRRARPGAAGRQLGAPSWRSCSTTCSATGPGSTRPGPATDGPHVVVVLDGGDLTGAATWSATAASTA